MTVEVRRGGARPGWLCSSGPCSAEPARRAPRSHWEAGGCRHLRMLPSRARTLPCPAHGLPVLNQLPGLLARGRRWRSCCKWRMSWGARRPCSRCARVAKALQRLHCRAPSVRGLPVCWPQLAARPGPCMCCACCDKNPNPCCPAACRLCLPCRCWNACPAAQSSLLPASLPDPFVLPAAILAQVVEQFGSEPEWSEMNTATAFRRVGTRTDGFGCGKAAVARAGRCTWPLVCSN